MKDSDELGQDSPLGTEQGFTQNDNPQALGKFLLDEQNNYHQTPEISDIDDLAGFTSAEKNPRNKFVFKTEGVQQRALSVKTAENPLLEAAQPLLRALSDMPEEIPIIENVEVLKKSLMNEINLFGVVCDEVDISWKKMAIVRYCICTALDEAAHTTPWGLLAGWSQSNLLNHFEGDNDGGNKFFLLIGRLSMNPHEYVDVLEVLLRILGLGFEGRYSIIDDGDRQLTKIRQRLLIIIQSTRDTTPSILSPNGLATRIGKRKERFSMPVRVTALFSGILVVTAFIWCKYWISVNERKIGQDVYAMQNLNVAKPNIAQRLRLSVLLKNEIQKQLLSVDEKKGQGKITFKGDSTFLVGSAQIKPEMEEVLKRVSKEVRRVNGSVLIIGHTDSMPIHKPEFPNNKVLSEKRAADVAQYFIEEGIPKDRIKIQGAGDAQPVSSNNDNQGRAKNRRVEIFVTY